MRLALIVVTCSLVAVIWQLGVIPLLGYGMDPMSILVPFLVFAIAVSHAVQMVSAARSEVFIGVDSLTASRIAFRRLLAPGSTALTTDVIGFLTLLVIQIRVIQEIAIAASLGVAMILLTNLVLLPVVLSYVRYPANYHDRLQRRVNHMAPLWRVLAKAAAPRPAAVIVAWSPRCSSPSAGGRATTSRSATSTAGVPELRSDSRYNRDTAMVTSKFSIGVDILTVIAETKPEGCVDFGVMTAIDEFSWRMANVEGVQSTIDLAGVARTINAGWNEGSPKWRVLARNPSVLTQSVTYVPTSTGLLNSDCSVIPIMVFSADHKAETLARIVAEAKRIEAGPATPASRSGSLPATSASWRPPTRRWRRRSSRCWSGCSAPWRLSAC